MNHKQQNIHLKLKGAFLDYTDTMGWELCIIVTGF